MKNGKKRWLELWACTTAIACTLTWRRACRQQAKVRPFILKISVVREQFVQPHFFSQSGALRVRKELRVSDS